MGVKTAMQAAEQLYVAGLLSYPRTETQVFVQDLDCLGIVRMLGKQPRYEAYVRDKLFGAQSLSKQTAGASSYEQYLSRLVSNNMSGTRAGRKDDKSHPPLHPVRAPHGGLQSTEEAVYDSVSRLFLASVSLPKRTLQLKFSTLVQDVEYQAFESFVLDPGFEEILTGKGPDRIPPELVQFC